MGELNWIGRCWFGFVGGLDWGLMDRFLEDWTREGKNRVLNTYRSRE